MAYKYIQEIQGQLTTDAGTEGSLLIEKKIYETLIEEVEKNLIPRTEAAIYLGPSDIPGSSIDLNLVTPDTMKVHVVAEGSTIPLSAPTFTNTNIKPKKYATRIVSTTEMSEDGKFKLMDVCTKLAAKRLAENETNLIITALDGATAGTVAGGANVTLTDINTAVLYVENQDYTPTTMLIGGEAYADLREIDTFVEVNKAGSDSFLRRNMIGTLFAMNVYRFSRNAAPSTTYAKYVYIFDNSQGYAIAEKRPITVENYDAVAQDLHGSVVTQRLAVSLIRSTAVAKITSS